MDIYGERNSVTSFFWPGLPEVLAQPEFRVIFLSDRLNNQYLAY